MHFFLDLFPLPLAFTNRFFIQGRHPHWRKGSTVALDILP